MSSLQGEEWVVQDLRLPILTKMTVETQPEGVERAHNSDAKMVRMSGQQDESTNMESIHIMMYSLLPRRVTDIVMSTSCQVWRRGQALKDPQGELCMNLLKSVPQIWRHWGLGIPLRNLIYGSQSWVTSLQEGKLPLPQH